MVVVDQRMTADTLLNVPQDWNDPMYRKELHEVPPELDDDAEEAIIVKNHESGCLRVNHCTDTGFEDAD